jgi:hypothetical protein
VSPNDVQLSLGSLPLLFTTTSPPLPPFFDAHDVTNTYSEPKRRLIVVGLAFSPHHPFSPPPRHDGRYGEPKRRSMSLGSLFHYYHSLSPYHRPFVMPTTRGRIQRAQTMFDRRWACLFTTAAFFHHTTHSHYHHDTTDAYSEPNRRSIVVGLVLSPLLLFFTTLPAV